MNPTPTNKSPFSKLKILMAESSDDDGFLVIASVSVDSSRMPGKTLAHDDRALSVQMRSGRRRAGRMIIDGQPGRGAVCHDGFVSERNSERGE